MEEIRPKTGNYSWKYGALAGAATIVFSLMLNSMDMLYLQNMAINIIPFVLVTIAIILGIVQFKKQNLGFLKLPEALKIGTGVGVVVGIITIFYMLLLTNVIEPDYMDNMFEVQKQTVMADNPQITEEQMDQGLEMQKKFAFVGYLFAVVMYTLLGLIVGLITGLILKKQNPAY
jgi:hypothetical protein